MAARLDSFLNTVKHHFFKGETLAIYHSGNSGNIIYSLITEFGQFSTGNLNHSSFHQPTELSHLS